MAAFVVDWIAIPGNQISDCAAMHEEIHLNPIKHMVMSRKGSLKKWDEEWDAGVLGSGDTIFRDGGWGMGKVKGVPLWSLDTEYGEW